MILDDLYDVHKRPKVDEAIKAINLETDANIEEIINRLKMGFI